MGDHTHEGDGNTQEEEPKEQRTLPDACRTLKDVRSSAEDLVNRIRWPLWWPWAPIEPFTAEPEADIVDKDGEFRVTIDLPGVAKQDIEIYATRDSIELAAEKSEEHTRTKVKYLTRERDCASFKRVLALSEEIIPDQTEASFEDGILTLVLKQRPPEPARERVKIEIK